MEHAVTTASRPTSGKARSKWWFVLFGVAALGAASWLTRDRWLPFVASGEGNQVQDSKVKPAAEEEHAHDHGSSNDNSIVLSERGLKNIGFVPATVALQTFTRTQNLPAIVVEQPGRTQIQLSSPFGGILTKVYVVEGEAIEPGNPMFEVRLTHEELVTSQQEFLKTAESLEIIEREIRRLETLGEGVIAGKRILEQQYEKQKLEVALRSTEQALLLHGLTEDQVAEILKTRRLLRSVTVFAPAHSHEGETCIDGHTFHIQRLPVSPGQQIDASQELAVLADHCGLYLEGRAFEDDANELRTAAKDGWGISASLLTGDSSLPPIDNLKLLYLADTIDPVTRAFRFYLQLPNNIVLDQKSAEGKRFIDWEFKPGQRFELHVPIEKRDGKIVVPVEAIVEEGAEFYVYRQNGTRFDRVAVHVEFRDNTTAVIANDGALFPGDVIAGRGAYQMHLALKNKSGGGVDPHAGHNH